MSVMTAKIEAQRMRNYLISNNFKEIDTLSFERKEKQLQTDIIVETSIKYDSKISKWVRIDFDGIDSIKKKTFKELIKAIKYN